MTTAVRCGTLIDGTGSDPLRGATLLLDGNTITGVDRSGEVPRGAEVIDAGHLTVMPGMIDCHVHFASQSSWGLQERLLTPYSLLIAHALNNARITLEAGFTSVRDAGGTPRGVKMAIEQGLFPGPRMRIAVAALSQTGGHGDSTMPNGANIRPSIELPLSVVDGIEGVRRATREILRAGADQIKVHTSGGVMSPNDEPGATGFSPDEIGALVYEARAAGKTVMAHAQATQGIKNAVRGGIDSIEHGIFLDEEVIEAMKQRGTYFVPTLVAPLWVLRRAEKDPSSVPPYAARKAREVLDDHRRSFQLAVERGVRIAMGTDTGVGPHGTNAEELERMVEGGMKPMDVLVATTKVAAECTRIGHLTGTLEPGKRADLLGVDGDPLSNIGVLQDKDKLALIMKDGNAFKSTIAAPAAVGAH